MPQSVWCKITRCPLLGGWPWPSRPSRAHERSTAGVIRPPMLRITTPSPSLRPSTSPGSTRESTQPSTCRVSLVGKERPANVPVAANVALRRTSSSELIAMRIPPYRRSGGVTGAGQLRDLRVRGEPRAALPGHRSDHAVQHAYQIAAADGFGVHRVSHRPAVLAGRLELRQPDPLYCGRV